jgi:hypothetical protein
MVMTDGSTNPNQLAVLDIVDLDLGIITTYTEEWTFCFQIFGPTAGTVGCVRLVYMRVVRSWPDT